MLLWLCLSVEQFKTSLSISSSSSSFSTRTSQQLMGDLPASRIRPARPFSNSGLDFAGPFTVKEGSVRKPLQKKAYVCVYICFATKAVYFDLVADLTSEAFIASLRRFIALYGVPCHIYSDNGSNFVGAHKELSSLRDLLLSATTQEAVHQLCYVSMALFSQ